MRSHADHYSVYRDPMFKHSMDLIMQFYVGEVPQRSRDRLNRSLQPDWIILTRITTIVAAETRDFGALRLHQR